VELVAAFAGNDDAAGAAPVAAMSDDRRRGDALAFGTDAAVAIEAQLAGLSSGELAGAVREALEQYGRSDPPDDLVAALCVVAAGFLRTGPVIAVFPEEAKEGVVAGFVRAFASAPSDGGPYGLVRQFLADAFHQRELPAPPPVTLDVLHRATTGLMSTKTLSAAVAAHASVKIGSYPRFSEKDFKVLVTLEGRDTAEVEAAFALLVERIGARVVRSEAPALTG